MKHLALALVAACRSYPDAHPATGDDPRIARVEAALVPQIVVRGQTTAPTTIAARMAYYRIPAVSVAVVDGGRIAWAKAYGSVAAGGAPATVETLFQAGSISKAVASVGALDLVQRGVLALDRDVAGQLTSWHIPANDFGAPVTLRELLSHSAGMTVHGFAGYEVGAPVPTLVQVLDGAPPANSEPIRVEAAPGTRWQYSGGGYTVVQQLMIDVARQPFPALMAEHVLAPLGMTHSTYQQPLPPELVARAASGTYADGTAVRGHWHIYPEMAAAGLWTTPTDLARLVIELQSGHRVLTAATVAAMLTPVVGDSYGLGLVVRGQAGARRFAHDGVDEGFEAKLVGYAESGRGAVVMANSGNGLAIAGEVLRAIAREYRWPDYPGTEIRDSTPIPPDLLNRLAGIYTGSAGTLGLAVTEGRAELFDPDAPRKPRSPVYGAGANHLFSIEPALDFEAIVEDGAVTRLRVTVGSASVELRRK